MERSGALESSSKGLISLKLGMQLFLNFSIEHYVEKKIIITILRFEIFLSQFKKDVYFAKQPGKLTFGCVCNRYFK